MEIGILELQGCCRPHRQKLAELGVAARRVIYAGDLAGLDGLILPGGESTTMLKAAGTELWDALREFGRQRPVWGICAGCILMAKTVSHPVQRSMGLLDITVERNAYGAQNESFIDTVELEFEPQPLPWEAIFIRAPRISSCAASVRVLARHGANAIFVEQGRHLASTFHPELTPRPEVHRYFLAKIASGQA